MRRMLRHEIRQRGCTIGTLAVTYTIGRLRLAIEAGRRLATGKCWRIQIVAEIEAHRTDRCPVTDPYPYRVGDITVIALGSGARLQAELRVLLAPAEEVVQHVPAIGKDVPRVLENGEAEVVLEVGQRRRWKAQFHIIQDKRTPA